LEVECSATVPWLQELGVNYHLAANEISLLMMFMGGLGTCVVLSSCSNERIGRACLCLALEGLCFGALLSEDALLLLSLLGFISPVVGLLLYEERENLPVLAAWRSAFILFAMGS